MAFLQLSEAHIIGAAISFLVGLFVVPCVANYSQKKGLVDEPNERKIHSHPIPRLGGIAIWLCTMITFLALVLLSYYPNGSLLSGILLGSSLMFLLGLVDDLYCLNAKFKLFVQVAIVTIVFALGIRIETIYIPFVGLYGLNIILSYLITIGWIVGISNAVNFIDGVDGLAGSIITISSVTIGLIAVGIVPANTVTALIAFILSGAMLGFLTYNFHPAKIFMGDSGALFAGFLLATLSVTYSMKMQTIAMYVPLFILSVPILDITFSSLRRIAKGKSPFLADAEHIHHKLLKAGFSQNKTVLILSSFALVSGIVATCIVSVNLVKYFLYAIVFIALMLILSYLAKK